MRGRKSELCPVEDFKEAIKPYAIDDQEYREVCSSNILDIIAKGMIMQHDKTFMVHGIDKGVDKAAHPCFSLLKKRKNMLK